MQVRPNAADEFSICVCGYVEARTSTVIPVEPRNVAAWRSGTPERYQADLGPRSGPGSNSAPPLPAEPKRGAVKIPSLARESTSRSISGSSIFASRNGSVDVVSITMFSSSSGSVTRESVFLSSAIAAPGMRPTAMAHAACLGGIASADALFRHRCRRCRTRRPCQPQPPEEERVQHETDRYDERSRRVAKEPPKQIEEQRISREPHRCTVE